jgi:hypothetical protein
LCETNRLIIKGVDVPPHGNLHTNYVQGSLCLDLTLKLEGLGLTY